jgi:hypothetical protein
MSSSLAAGLDRRSRVTSGHAALIAVAALFVVTVLLRTSQSMALGYDEAVYASQVVGDVPAAPFSAHRARGVPVLLAPVAVVTGSEVAIRTYLALLSGVAMYLAFRPWLWVLTGTRGQRFAPAVAAGLFGSVWVTVLHGTLALPNLWLAFALATGVGYVCRELLTPYGGWSSLWWIAGAFAVAALLRPTDTVAAAAPVLFGIVVIIRRAWSGAVVALVAGLAVGWAAWAAEAYASFGDPVTRLRSGAESVGGGLAWNLSPHLESAAGCPPACEGVPWPQGVWWLALPALVALGLVAARRTGVLAGAALPVVAGVGAAVPYLLMVDVLASARFLLPAYALLAPAAAVAVVWLVERRHAWSRVAAVTAVLLLGVAHVVVQQQVLVRTEQELSRGAQRLAVQAQYLREAEDVRAPCLVVGEAAAQLGYLLACRALRSPEGVLPAREDEIATALRCGEAVVVRVPEDAAVPDFLAGWRRVELPDTSDVALRPPA